MAILIVQEPDEICISRNRMPLIVAANPLNLDDGLPEKAGLNCTGSPANNDTFTFEWNGVVHTFTFKTTPNVNLSTELPLKGGLSHQQYAELLAVEISQYLPINDDWFVYPLSVLGVWLVFFESRNVGTIYNLTLGGTSPLTYAISQSGTDLVPALNNFILLTIYVENLAVPNTWDKLETVFHPLVLSPVEFDLQDYLNAFVEGVAPAYRDTSPATANLIRRQYYFEVCQIYDVAKQLQHIPIYRSQPKWVLMGGINIDDYGDMIDRICERKLWLSRQFLTNRSRFRTIPGSADEFLYFFCFTKQFDAQIDTVDGSVSGQITITCHGTYGAYDPFLSDGGGLVDVTYTYASIEETRQCNVTFVGNNNVFELTFPDTYNLQYVTDFKARVVDDGPNPLTLRCNILYTDGTTVSDQVLFTEFWAPKDVFIWPAGVTNSGIAALDPTRTVAHYELYVVYLDSRVSHAVRYTMELDDYKDFWLLFENGLSGYDTLRCFNTAIPSQESEKLIISKPLPLLADKTHRATRTVRAGHLMRYALNSGNLSFDEYSDLIEMLNCEDVLIVKNAMYLTAYTEPGKAELKDKDDTWYNHNFEVIEAKKHLGR